MQSDPANRVGSARDVQISGDAIASRRTPGGAPVVVCGAGAAGMAASIAASRAGHEVLLIEDGDQVGGTMADALLHTLAGLYDSRGEYVNGGLAQELAERLLRRDASVRRRRMGRVWVLNVDPDLYREEVQRWLANEPRIRIHFRTRASRARLDASVAEDGSPCRRVVELELDGPDGASKVFPRALVDATGKGALVSNIDVKLHRENPESVAGGWVFRMRGVAPGALNFPRGAALLRALRDQVAEGGLPPECEKAWVDAGVYEDEVFVKLFVPLGPGWKKLAESGEIAVRAMKNQGRLADFLRTQPGFESARVTQSSRLGIRDGGCVEGEYTLTRSDVLELRRFEDAACRCSWPIEYWDSKAGVSLEYLPEGGYYEIPMRSLKIRTLENVWVAGKCLSADRFAQASARCVGTCWAMGEAVGRRAASFDVGSSSNGVQGNP